MIQKNQHGNLLRMLLQMFWVIIRMKTTELVGDLEQAYQAVDRNISPKTHTWIFFSKNLEVVSNEYGVGKMEMHYLKTNGI